MAVHANIVFGENGQGRCKHCESRTALISFYINATVDQEAFESGEYNEDTPEAKAGLEIPDDVDVGDELTGHYCLKCDRLTSICFNEIRTRSKPSKFDPELEFKLFLFRCENHGVTAWEPESGNKAGENSLSFLQGKKVDLEEYD